MRTSKYHLRPAIQRILEALEQSLADDGFDNVSLSQLAEKAKVSKSTVYHYFDSLEGLLEYYVCLGRLIPHYSEDLLNQLQPVHPQDLASLWSTHTLKLFRQFRSSRAARHILQTTTQAPNDPRANAISKSLDTEFTGLSEQLAFVEGADHLATSAVILGGLSYLTILAQQNHTMLRIDLRSETGWRRVEEAVKLIFKALNQLAIDSSTTQLLLKPPRGVNTTW